MVHLFLHWMASCLAVAGFPGSAPAPVPQVVLVPNYGGDDTETLYQLVNNQLHSGDTLKFGQGVYDFYSDPCAHCPLHCNCPFPGFSFTGMDNITITGWPGSPGTTLVFHGFDPMLKWQWNASLPAGAYPHSIFKFDDVHGVTIKNLKIKMDREPYSSGIVSAKNTSVGDNWIEIEMEQDYADLLNGLNGLNGFQIEDIHDFDPASRRLRNRDFGIPFLDQTAYVTTVRHELSQQVVRIASNDAWFVDQLAKIPVDPVHNPIGLVLMHSQFRCGFVVANRCSDLVVQDVNVRDLPGIGVLAYNTHNVTLDNYDMVPKPDRLLSGTAGGALLQDATGAIVMKNCDFQRIGDDCLDSSTRYLEVDHVIDVLSGGKDVQLKQVTSGSTYYNIEWAGQHEVEFFSPTLERRGVPVQMKDFTPALLAKFDPGVLPPTVVPGDFVWNHSVIPDSVHVENCTFENNLTHGLYLHSSNISVTGCTFHWNAGPAVILQTNLESFQVAGPVSNASITHCVIDDVNRYFWSEFGAISVMGRHRTPGTPICTGGDSTLAAAGLHQGITIASNTFTNLWNESGTIPTQNNSRAALWVTSSDGVHLNSNEFLNIHYDVNQTDENILRGENNTNLTSDGNNYVPGFPQTLWFALNCSGPNPPTTSLYHW